MSMREIIKKRTVRVIGVSCEGCVSEITDVLLGIDGVRNASAGTDGVVSIEYDLMKVNLESIETKLRAIHHPPSTTLLERMRRGWIHFTEENEYENMNAAGHSCCSDPKHGGRE